MNYEEFGIKKSVIDIADKIETDLQDKFAYVNKVAENNQLKVMKAFIENNISTAHLGGTTGYGYDDIGREAIEKVFAQVFGAEDALVRVQFVNGTHALSTMLTGILRPNDYILSATGELYDTLNETIKYLKSFGVKFDKVDILENGEVDYDGIIKKVSETKPNVVYIQRSKGYSWRNGLFTEDIKKIIDMVKDINKDTICIVDNCYGEFCEEQEPTNVGADLMAGSLIKNAGGGLAPMGGYIAGRHELVEKCAERLTAPGIGKECGATLGVNKDILMGFFMAPHVVGEAVKGAIFCGEVFKTMGMDTMPYGDKRRTDIVQMVKLGSREKLIKFCQAVQSVSPIDAFALPMPAPMPGYEDEVIMAAGTFVQGASIEMSADGPLREPYIVYIQGGLTYAHAKLATMKATSNIL